MKLKHIFIIALVSFSAVSMVKAQSSIDLLTVETRYGFTQDSAVDEAGNPIPGENTERGSMINLKIPLALSEKTMFYSSITQYYSRASSTATLDASLANPIKLHGTILQTGVIRTLNEKQKLHLLFVPRFMGDGVNLSSNNFQFGGVAMFENRYSDKLMMRFGLLFNQEELGPTFTPLIHLDWQVSDKWSIVGTLPLTLKVSREINKDFSAGFSHFALITSYRQGNDAYQDDYIERTSIDLTLFARHRISNNLFIEGRAGYAMSRRYEQFAESQKADFRILTSDFGNERTVKNQIMDGGPVVNLQLIYNLPID